MKNITANGGENKQQVKPEGTEVKKPRVRVKLLSGTGQEASHNGSVAHNLTARAKKAYSEQLNYNYTLSLREGLKLHTVCEEAKCPNIRECWGKKHASFMIMGSICTRKCSFCNIATGKPMPLDPKEPINVAMAVQQMGLQHVVVTSVDRDDLPDGGANHFAETIHSIRSFSPETTIEVLTPDFLKKGDSFKIIVEAGPDVFNHNIETVPSLYPSIRPIANYFNSLSMLGKVKEINPNIFTKSGFMVGLGETDQEIFQLMDDMKAAEIDFITIGQYLRPTEKHAQVKRYVSEETFAKYKRKAERKGFLMVSASPLTRSSYHADESFKKLKEKRLALIQDAQKEINNKIN